MKRPAWLCRAGFHGKVIHDQGSHNQYATTDGTYLEINRVTEHTCGHRIRRATVKHDLKTVEVEDIAPPETVSPSGSIDQ